MTPLGKTCTRCHKRPAIRTDGLCAVCGEQKDTSVDDLVALLRMTDIPLRAVRSPS